MPVQGLDADCALVVEVDQSAACDIHVQVMRSAHRQVLIQIAPAEPCHAGLDDVRRRGASGRESPGVAATDESELGLRSGEREVASVVPRRHPRGRVGAQFAQVRGNGRVIDPLDLARSVEDRLVPLRRVDALNRSYYSVQV